MSFVPNDMDLPIRLRTEIPMTDEAMFEFCRRNDTIRIELDATGELVLTSTRGLEGSNWNSKVNAYLTIWDQRLGDGMVFDSNGGFTLPDGLTRGPDAALMSRQRWAALPASEQGRFGHVMPHLFIALKSETNALNTLQEKMEI